MIENMSMHICSNCGHAEHIFGEDGAERLAETYHTEVLGSLPLSKYIRVQADAGTPPVVAADDCSEVSMMYRHAARRLAVALARQAAQSDAIPTIEVSDEVSKHHQPSPGKGVPVLLAMSLNKLLHCYSRSFTGRSGRVNCRSFVKGCDNRQPAITTDNRLVRAT